MEAFAAVVDLVDGRRAQRGDLPQSVDLQRVRDRLRQQGHGHVADSPGFQELFNFVISIGGSRAGFAAQLLDFDRRFVNHKKRTLPLQAFQTINELSNFLPRTKVALVMRCYCKDAVRGLCSLPETSWARLNPEVVRSLEELLVLMGGIAL